MSSSDSSQSSRFVSLDALRGFDMFWIIGMEEFAEAIGKASQAPWAQFFAKQLSHVSWEGFRFLDLIFPMFVFITGASMVFSLDKSRQQRGTSGTVWRLARRCFVLYLLGLLYYGGISKGLEGVRWLGVLQRIAICGFFAGLAFLFLKPRGRGILAAGLLLGYWAIMCFVPAGGLAAGTLTPGQNVAAWVDANFLPGHRWNTTWDPEGILSTFPAIGSALFGVFAAEWLRSPGRSASQKALWLMLAGAICSSLGWRWHLQFPVIKNIWTSSFVLVAGGYSAMLLGAFSWIIEGKGWSRWAAPFIWIGLNPITIYLAHAVFEFHSVAERIGGGPIAGMFGAGWGKVWIAALVLAQGLLLVWWLNRKKIYLRV